MSIPEPEKSPHSFTFTNPNFDNLGRHIIANSKLGLPLVEHNCHSDARGAVVCAPGPTLLKSASLRDLRARVKRGWWVIAIKEAITLLRERGIAVHYSVAMDPDAGQTAKTPLVREVVYCVASSCHPDLFEYLASHHQEVRVFHSCCGWSGLATTANGEIPVSEVHLYKALYGRADVMVGGYTVVNRAVALAKYMGFREVAVYGAPFGWRPTWDYYAKGVTGQAGNEGKDLCDHGRIDGTPWYTRPDMVASALHLSHHVRDGTVKVIGDSLAASLAKLSPERLAQIFPQEKQLQAA